MKGVLSLFALAILGITNSLVVEDVVEPWCCRTEKWTPDKNWDESYWASVPVLYIPFASEYENYETAVDCYGPDKFARMTIDDFKGDCVTYKKNFTSAPVQGFKCPLFEYRVFPHPVTHGIEFWTFPKSQNKNQDSRTLTTYVTKTDNKSYFVTATVREDKRKGFYVSTTTRVPDPTLFAEIKAHVLSLGFDPKHFVIDHYEGCPPPLFLGTAKHY